MATQTMPESLLIVPPGKPDPVWSMLAISILLHLVVLLVAANLRFVRSIDRPLSKEYEVSLVTLPAPVKPQPARAVKPVSPPVPPRPVTEPVKPAESAPPKATEGVPPPPPVIQSSKAPEVVTTPAPTPPPPAQSLPETPQPVPVTPPRPRITIPALKLPEVTSSKNARSKATVENMLRDVTLPPDAPELGDIKPMQAASAPRSAQPDERVRNLQRTMEQLAVPDAKPVAPPVRAPSVPPPAPVPMPSQAERIEKVLQSLPKAGSLEPRRDVSAVKPEPAPVPPVQTAKAAPSVETRMQIKSPLAGSNEYLARVQTRISEQWVAPPVGAMVEALTVVVQFRLHRDGTVTQISIEKTSGNGYYDDAGRRAVQAASPLPPFPAWLTDSSLDAHFTFSVGQQAG